MTFITYYYHYNIYKLKEGKLWLDIRRMFFTGRVVRYWNRMLREVVDAPTLEEFKARWIRP